MFDRAGDGRALRCFIAGVLLCWCAGCPKSRDKREPRDAASGDEVDAGEARDSGIASGTSTCVQGGWCTAVDVLRVDKLDLLFSVGNSSGMASPQQSLAQALPVLMQALTTGVVQGAAPLPPASDIHFGVVSADMGVPGVTVPGCDPNGGDDGRLLHESQGAGCAAMYPQFLSFSLGASDPNTFGSDASCIARVGTDGCAIQQPLEAAFKALWPKEYKDAAGNVVSNPYQFLSTSAEGTTGRGDLPAAQGGNAGFLRNDRNAGRSLIAVIVVTDQNDCSVRVTDHLMPPDSVPQSSPYAAEKDMRLRCFNHPEFSHDVSRYLKGFRMLRPERESLVVFGVIAGVPRELVSTITDVDFADETKREAFYTTMLTDSRMQEAPDPDSNLGSGTGHLTPSCSLQPAGASPAVTAFPPTRLVHLARAFGANGLVHSICQDDFAPAMTLIARSIGRQLAEQCLPRALTRGGDGKVACDVVWELPAPGASAGTTPVACDASLSLTAARAPRAVTNAAGGVNCVLPQLAAHGAVPTGDGWYYDDFSEEGATACIGAAQRIVFTDTLRPPAGVKVMLDCKKSAAPAQ